MSSENSFNTCSAIIQTGPNKGQLCNRENCIYKGHKISSIERKITDLEKKCQIHEELLYQFIGGLFNQRTQGDIINSHLDYLTNTPRVEKKVKEYNIWPTTRQGDKNEHRLNLLEEEVRKLMDERKERKIA